MRKIKYAIFATMKTKALLTILVLTGGAFWLAMARTEPQPQSSRPAPGLATLSFLESRSVVTNDTTTCAALGSIAVSPVSGGGRFDTHSTNWVAVPNLAVTIRTSGRPVFVGLEPAAVPASGGHWTVHTASWIDLEPDPHRHGASGYVGFTRDGRSLPAAYLSPQSGPTSVQYGPGSVFYIDQPPPGTHTYRLQVTAIEGKIGVMNCKLVVYEL